MKRVRKADPITLEDDELSVDRRLQRSFGRCADRLRYEIEGRSGEDGDHGKHMLSGVGQRTDRRSDEIQERAWDRQILAQTFRGRCEPDRPAELDREQRVPGGRRLDLAQR